MPLDIVLMSNVSRPSPLQTARLKEVEGEAVATGIAVQGQAEVVGPRTREAVIAGSAERFGPVQGNTRLRRQQDEIVVAALPVEEVAAAADQRIPATAAPQDIGAVAAVETIVAGSSVQGVAPSPTDQTVVASAPVDDVVIVRAQQGIGLLRSVDRRHGLRFRSRALIRGFYRSARGLAGTLRS
nr:hypothetical protein [Methylorubrum aminovorans]